MDTNTPIEENELAMEILKLLRQANMGANYFALPIGIYSNANAQEAVVRCTFNGWIQLIDVRPIEGKTGLFRMFVLTQQGLEHLKTIESFMTQHDQKPN